MLIPGKTFSHLSSCTHVPRYSKWTLLYSPVQHSIYIYISGVLQGIFSRQWSEFANWKYIDQPSLLWTYSNIPDYTCISKLCTSKAPNRCHYIVRTQKYSLSSSTNSSPCLAPGTCSSMKALSITFLFFSQCFHSKHQHPRSFLLDPIIPKAWLPFTSLLDHHSPYGNNIFRKGFFFPLFQEVFFFIPSRKVCAPSVFQQLYL